MAPSRLARVAIAFLALLTLAASSYGAECPRLISQAPYLTKSLQWLGLEPCIVGVSRYDSLDRPRTGGVLDPDREVIETLAPDLIFSANWISAEELQNVTPAGAKSYRLDGFAGMAQVEENLRLMGRATGITDIEQRVAAFHRQWLAAAHTVHGNGLRVLLLSSCSGNPYSFGRQRWLSELFSEAGFINVETEPMVRSFAPDKTIPTLNALIDKLHPQLLFVFERKLNPQCNLILPKRPLRIITLDGDKFLHPAPVVVAGLAELASKQHQWLAAETK